MEIPGRAKLKALSHNELQYPKRENSIGFSIDSGKKDGRLSTGEMGERGGQLAAPLQQSCSRGDEGEWPVVRQLGVF